MSVINQMLKDLDARGGGDAQRRAALASAGISVGRSPASVAQRPWLKGLYLVLLVGMAVGAWILGNMLVDQRVAEPEALPAIFAPALAVPEASPATPLPAVTPDPLVAAPAPVASRAAAETPAPIQPPARAEPAKPARQIIEVLPESPDTLADVRELLARGDAAAALASIRALGTSPDAETLALRATAQQQMGQHAEAATDYTAALNSAPDVAAWWVGLGIALEGDGRPSEAITAFQQAERRGPLDPALSRYVGARIEALSNGEPTTR